MMNIKLQAKQRLTAAPVQMVDTAVAKYLADNRAKLKRTGGKADVTIRGKSVGGQAGPEGTPTLVSITLMPNGKWKVEFVTRFKSTFKTGDKITDEQAVSLLKSFVDAQYASVKASAISEPQIDELKSKGYEVEDMGKVYGPSWHGQYRWANGEDFQDHDTSDTVGEAWTEAWAHHKKHGQSQTV